MTRRRGDDVRTGANGTKHAPNRAVQAVNAPTRAINRPDDEESSRDDWRSQAACHEADPDLFVPTLLSRGRPGRSIAEKIGEALSYCARCPVTCECLTYALEHDEYGVWGNTTDADRSALRRSGRIRERCPCCQSQNVVQYGGFLGRECLACQARWR